MKYLVLLAGCGLGDGSCIEEVILTYVALDKYGCDYTPVAEDVSVQSVNHLTEQIAEKRNILIEAARIGRGRIKDIREVDFAEYDALIIPGGIGLLNNYRASNVIKTKRFAQLSVFCTVNFSVAAITVFKVAYFGMADSTDFYHFIPL